MLPGMAQKSIGLRKGAMNVMRKTRATREQRPSCLRRASASCLSRSNG